MYQRGCVHWASLPGDKRRPVLILSPAVRNERASDLIVVPLSTVLREGPWHVRLRKREGGLPDTSIAKCEQITTLHKSCLSIQPLGSPVSAARMAEIERAVLRAIGVAI